MGYIPNREEALELLKEYNKEEFHLKHAETVAAVLVYFAKIHDPENVDYWEVVGLLHDLDFEMWPDEHCVKVRELLTEKGYDSGLIDSICSHGWDCTDSDVEPTSFMEKILYATDELTGLIGAAALMRPSKSVSDMELKSLKKKFKDKKFAAGCSRDVIVKGAEMLGWELDELLQNTLDAMKSFA